MRIRPKHSNDNEQNRFGSAAWADEESIRRAQLFGKAGLQLGYLGDRPLRHDGDAPVLTVGGAGSGKLRDQLG